MRLAPTDTVVDKGLRLVAAFEGGGDGALAGDFDGQVLSWGPLQWNLGRGTLQPLLRRIYELNPDHMEDAVGRTFTTAMRGDLIAFARTHILDGNLRPHKAWSAAFRKLADLPEARQAFREHAEWYVKRATFDATRLRLVSERGWVLMLDTAVQNGGLRVHDHLPSYWSLLQPDDIEEWQHLKALAKAISAHSLERWRSDVLSRKLTIAVREGIVHGRRYDIYRDFRISHTVDWAQNRPWGAWTHPGAS